jgi:energy-coupling factor transporter ATP-binding protein EcfA2
MPDLFKLLQIVERAPDALKFLTEADRAFNAGRQVGGVKVGAASTAAYVMQGGWRSGLGAVNPRLRDATDAALPEAGRAYRVFRNHLNGVTADPTYEPRWAQLKRWKMKQPSGANIIVGQTGSGKTTLARSLGAALADKWGYPLECLNVYENDIPYKTADGNPLDVRIIDTDVLNGRMERVRKAMKKQITQDPGAPQSKTKALMTQSAFAEESVDQEELSDETKSALADLPFRGRVLLIDEMGLEDMSTNVKARNAVTRALTQSRHLDWIVLYIGQQFSQFPKPLLGQSTIFIKRPTGREADMDRQIRFVRMIWNEAHSAFQDVRDFQEWDEFPDYRSWAYVIAPVATGLSEGYSGMMPFSRLDSTE